MENQEKRCMGCMNPLPDGRSSCGICGYPANGENPSGYLQVGTPLSDRYICGRALSVSGDATLYIGWDQIAKQPVSIREYLPTDLCRRTEDGRVEALEGKEVDYEALRQTFLQHARHLARCRDLAVVTPIYDIFEENGSAYTVGEYAPGTTLKNYMKKKGDRLSWMDARKLFLPFLSAVASCHAAGLYHYAINPETVVIGTDGRLHLTAFAMPQARMTNSSIKPQLMTGFAAPEQYAESGRVTPATDVYGLGAILFWMLSGVTPPDGAARDPESGDLFLPEEVVNSLPENVTAALVHALTPSADDRLATVEDLRDALGGVSGEKAAAAVVKDDNHLPRKYLALFGGIILALIVVIILLAISSCNGSGTGKDPSASTTTTEATLPSRTTASTTEQREDSQTVPDLMGKDVFSFKDGKSGDFEIKIAWIDAASNKEVGTIVEQQPAGGEKASVTEPIYVTISYGYGNLKVPDLTGWDEQDARDLLHALGYRVKDVMKVQSDCDLGKVDGTNPKAGTALPYGSEITLRISESEHPTVDGLYVPDVRGMDYMQAYELLTDIGLVVDTALVPVDDATQDNCVQKIGLPAVDDEVIPGETVVRVNSTVVLYYGHYEGSTDSEPIDPNAPLI